MAIPRAGNSESTPVTEWSFEDFGSINTKVSRPAIEENQFYWVENFFPIATGRLRTLAAEGTTLYAASGKTIIYTYSYILNNVPYWAVFLSDGSCVQVRVSDGATTTIGVAATFYSSSTPTLIPACAQFQNKYLAIINNFGTNNYWLWDGTSLFTAGTLSPDTTLTNVGSTYTSSPTVSITGGTGTGATASATVKNGVITLVTITNPGSGYSLNDRPLVTFSGGGSDTQAIATPVISATSGGITDVFITKGGTAYTTASIPTIAGGGGSGAQIVITGLSNGSITAVAIISPGTGYTSAPTLTFSVGNSATFVLNIAGGQITSVTATTGGSGYYSPPTVTVVGDGTGANITAIIAGGVVTGYNVISGGKNYTAANTSVLLSGGNKSASATVSIMPFGVQGTTIETYQNRVWTANGVNLQATAPGTVANVSITQGAVYTQLTDSSLRTTITRLAQSSGFLYGFGDSSVFSITNVTTGTTGVTAFNITNVDPQIGTSWRDSVASFGRALVFANPSGVYGLYGGAVEKVSNELDGLFLNANWTTVTPTTAIATINNNRVYILNFNTLDPYLNIYRTIMGMWDGKKWFMASQIKAPNFIQTQEINSTITSWGSDGTNLYQMFQTPSVALSKVFQTKLRKAPNYTSFKRSLRAYFVANNNGTDTNPQFSVSADTDASEGLPIPLTLKQSFLNFVNPAGVSLQFQNSLSVNINFYPTNVLSIDGFAISTYGRMIGYTLTTNGSDLDIISFTAQYGEFAPYG